MIGRFFTIAGWLLLDPLFSQEIKIDRQVDSQQWTELQNGLHRAEFVIPARDREWPEYKPVVWGLVYEKDPQAVLAKKLGIQFGAGSSAEFEYRTGKLVVVNLRPELEKIATHIELLELQRANRQVAARVEIYELSKLQVLQLLDSAAKHGDHQRERQAALRAVREGNARLVSTYHSLSLLQYRVQVDGTVQVPARKGLFGNQLVNSCAVIGPTTRAASALCSGLLGANANAGGRFKGKQIGPSYFRTSPKHQPQADAAGAEEFRGSLPHPKHGPVFEFSSYLRWDRKTILLEISLEHHKVLPQGLEDGSSGFPKKIESTFEIRDGAYAILASWSPGKGAVDADRWYIAFLTANVQTSIPR